MVIRIVPTVDGSVVTVDTIDIEDLSVMMGQKKKTQTKKISVSVKKTPKKPKYHKHPDTYDYHEVIEYIEKLYGIDTNDYANKFAQKDYGDKIPYQNYWHWLTENCGEVHNGCYSYIPLEITDDMPQFVKEITTLIAKEFKNKADEDGNLEVWIEW